tara:strand:- start:141 stop:614 length:474 start_codon:yes stop_codon:yes gene_type:complete
MAKTKVSEWDSVALNNLDIDGINIANNCPPSYINDAIRELMAQIKDWQVGAGGDPFTVTGNFTVGGTANFKGGVAFNDNFGLDGQVMVSKGSELETPVWTTLGTMSLQDSNAVSVTGGTLVDTKVNGNVVGSNSRGSRTVSTEEPTGGENGDIWYKI